MRRTVLLAALLLAVPASLAPATGAVASPALTTGVDVSVPQCSGVDTAAFTPPAVAPAFAVVGVNTGVGTETNPCLGAQAAWASGLTGGAGRPPLELYANTQHPTPADAKWWPTSDRTAAGATVHGPYGHCRGGDDRACAYVYGASIAGDDLVRATAALIPPTAARWWLDVESTNDWSRATADNRAVLEGMVVAFRAAHVRTGLYSTHRQWQAIVGSVPRSSPLTGLPSWLAGATTVPGAAARCSSDPLVAGSRVELAQAVLATSDIDVACGLLTAHAVRITGTAAVGRTLHVVTRGWSPGTVHLAYRWLRDGRALAHATAATYRLTAADRHHRVAVRVTGTADGFDAAIRTSAARAVG